MKMIPAYVVAVLFSANLANAQTTEYQVTEHFMPPLTREYYTVHDFNDSGIVAGTWIRYTEGGTEEARGIFVWRDGELRKITPAQGGVASTLSPAQGVGLGVVRISNVRPDQTFLLVAPAQQQAGSLYGNGTKDIYRLVKYTIEADLETFPQPVVSASTLSGYIAADFLQSGQSEEFSAEVIDLTDEGTVLGYTSDWPFAYAPTILRAPNGSGDGAYFSPNFFGVYGNMVQLDREGYFLGTVADANTNNSFLYDAPLSTVTLSYAEPTRFPSLGGFIDLVEGNPDNLIYSTSFVGHGTFRAMNARDSVPSTAVWSNRFQQLEIAQGFVMQSGSGAAYMPPRKNLSWNGHMLGYLSNQTANGWAVAVRQVDNSYVSTRIHDNLASTIRTLQPFSQSDPGYADGEFVTPLAINGFLEILCSYQDQRGTGFYILEKVPVSGGGGGGNDDAKTQARNKLLSQILATKTKLKKAQKIKDRKIRAGAVKQLKKQLRSLNGQLAAL